MTSRPLSRLVLPPLLAAAIALPAAAQEITGIVVGLDGRTPVSGALVRVMDQDDEQVWGALSNERGLFRMRAVPPGHYRLVTRRIGYADGETEWFDLGDPATLFFKIEIPRAAIAVDGITVDPDRRCRTLARDDASTIAQFWEEAQKALEVTRFTEANGDVVFRSRTFDRTLGPDDLELLSEEVTPHEGAGVMPFGSLPPDSLAEFGYLQGDGREGWIYNAPDATALLSSSFMNTHCLRFEDDRHLADSVGIRVQPAEGRDLPEIEGVLWLDGGTMKLRRFEFRYVNAELETDADRIGGEVRFEELVTGAWIVSGWSIRMASIGTTVRRGRTRYHLIGYREVGGEILEMWDTDGRWLRTAAPPPG